MDTRNLEKVTVHLGCKTLCAIFPSPIMLCFQIVILPRSWVLRAAKRPAELLSEISVVRTRFLVSDSITKSCDQNH
jgi:hypothetical protein